MLTRDPGGRGGLRPRGPPAGRGRAPAPARPGRDPRAPRARRARAACATARWPRAIVEHLAATGGLVTAEDLREYRVIDRRAAARSATGAHPAHQPAAVVRRRPDRRGPARRWRQQPSAGADDVEHYRAVARAGRGGERPARRRSSTADLHEEDCHRAPLGAPRGAAAGADRWPVSRKPTGSTTHISAVDADGGMASLSSSNGSGSGVVVPGTGILLNNMLGEEDLNPGGFGRLDPGRPDDLDDGAHACCCAAASRCIALGSAGSNRLRSAILQTVVSVVDGGLGRRRRRATPARPPRGRRRGRGGGRARGGGGGPRRRRPRGCAAGGRRTCSSEGSAPAGSGRRGPRGRRRPPARRRGGGRDGERAR